MKWTLADNIVLYETDDCYIIRGEFEKIKIEKSKLSEKIISQLIEVTQDKNKEIEEIAGSNIGQVLINKHIVVKEIGNVDENYNNKKFLSYFFESPDLVLKKIRSKNILIIGIGGIGQVALQHLIASGFHKFILVDFDLVNRKNMNRQFLITKNQFGEKKVKAVSDTIKNTYSDICIKTVNKKIETKRDLDEIVENNDLDFLLCCADYPSNAEIREVVVEKSMELNIPCAFAGVGVRIGEIGPILTSKEEKIRYKNLIKQNSEKILYNPILEGSICYTNSLVSILLGFEIFKYYSNIDQCKILNKTIYYDLFKYSILKEKEW